MTARRRRSIARWPVAALSLAAVATVTAFAPATASAGPSQEALDRLTELREWLTKAKQDAGRNMEFQRDADRAEIKKIRFVVDAFDGTKLFGNCDGPEVMAALTRIDRYLDEAVETKRRTRAAWVENAHRQAKALSKGVRDCATSGTPKALAATIKAIAKDLKSLGRELSDKNAKRGAKRAFERKQQLLAGETIDGCEVTEIFVLVEQIDARIVRAQNTEPNDFKKNGKKRTKQERRAIIGGAIGRLEELIRTYRKLPCGPTDDPPPPPGGGTTPPPPPPPPAGPEPACENGQDDDGDGTADNDGAGTLPPDEGCMSPQDTTEQHTNWPIGLPGDGGYSTNHLDFKPNFADTPPDVRAWAVHYNPTLHESSDPNQAATPISGTGPCDPPPDTVMLIDSGIGSQAPTVSPVGTPLPPPPDGNHMRIVLDIDDEAGGHPCAGTLNLRVVTDTR